MSESVDDQVMWLANNVIGMPTRRDAVRQAFDKIIAIGCFHAAEMPTLPCGDHFPRGFAEWSRRHDHHVLALAFELLALSTDDASAVIHSAVSGAIGLLCSAYGDTREARARLRVWEDVARCKYDPAAYGDDFFQIADKYWRGEMRFIVAVIPGEPMRDRFQNPSLQVLMFSRWDAALGWLHGASVDVAQRYRLDDVMSCSADRVAVAAVISDIVEDLYAVGKPSAGALALAWSMLTAAPRKPQSFGFLPQLQFAIDNADLEAHDEAAVRERVRIWWRAAEAEWTGSEVSIFRIADIETQRDVDVDDQPHPEPELHEMATSTSAARGSPTLVVMPKSKASELNSFHAQYKYLVDAALPLVVARDVAQMRAALHAEFPHATAAIDMLLRDLREGRPFSLKPVILVGSPGSGKSRVIRRLSDLVQNLYVYRFDASSSADSHFGGTSKAWGNTEPCVPARAIAQSRTANPIVLLDELDKAAERNTNGRLWDSLLPFCDRETAARYRDQSLDAELDLSYLSYAATANSAENLPSPLRDRFRIIRVPAPTLQHLPTLAANVMRDLAIEDEARQHDAPLADDELANISKAWERAKFSTRALQKIVCATLDARDSHAMRH